MGCVCVQLYFFTRVKEATDLSRKLAELQLYSVVLIDNIIIKQFIICVSSGGNPMHAYLRVSSIEHSGAYLRVDILGIAM